MMSINKQNQIILEDKKSLRLYIFRVYYIKILAQYLFFYEYTYIYYIMTVYLIKLILILVFNTCVNTYYINSVCNCCCGNSKSGGTGSRGGKSSPNVIELDNNKINIDLKNLKLSSNNIQECIVNASFTNRTTFCELDEANYNSFKTDIEITFKNPPAEDTFVLFAVKTASGKYYLGCCNKVKNEEDYGLFENVKANVEIKILGNGCNLNNIGSMFSGNINLGNIVFTKNFKTNNVNDMRFMFSNCSLLKELNLSNFNTNNVTDMRFMFYGCSSLKELNLSNFNTNNVTDMRYMFFGCTALKKKNIITKDNKTLQNFENT